MTFHYEANNRLYFAYGNIIRKNGHLIGPSLLQNTDEAFSTKITAVENISHSVWRAVKHFMVKMKSGFLTEHQYNYRKAPTAAVKLASFTPRIKKEK